MIRSFFILLLATLPVWAASPQFFFNSTNEMIAAPIPLKNTNFWCVLSGFTNKNEGNGGGIFEFVTNTVAEIDWTNGFPASVGNSEWRRVTQPVGDHAPASLKIDGNLWANSRAGFGISSSLQAEILTGGYITANGAQGSDIWLNSNVEASADNDVLYGLKLTTAFIPNGYSGLTYWGLYNGTAKPTYMGTGKVNLPGLAASRVLLIDSNGDIDAMGVPAADGYILSSTVAGVKSWVANAAGSSGGNPTASVGLTAVNGAASTFLRSDGAPAIDVGIIPTWTGLHTWSGGTRFSATTAYSASPTTELQGYLKTTSGGAFTTVAQVQFGKENATDANTAGYLNLATRPNGGALTTYARMDSTGNITLTNSSSDATIQVVKSDKTYLTFSSKKTAAAANLFQMGLAGRMYWGDGTNALNTTLFRQADNVLATDGTFQLAALDASKAVYSDANKRLISGLSGPAVNWTSAEVVTVASTTTPTTLLSTGLGSKTIGANILKAGSVIRYALLGNFNGDAVSPGNFDITVSVGSHSLTLNMTNQAGGANTWTINGAFTVYGAGANVGFSDVAMLTANTIVFQQSSGHSYSSSGFDTTATHDFNITADPSVNDADNNISSLSVTLETLNTNQQ